MAGTGMGMFQSQRQSMAMAPQMRQALEMLQMPLLDLHQAILREMESNPVLDMSDPVEIKQSEAGEIGPANRADTGEMDFDPREDALLRQEDEWRDYFMQGMENGVDVNDLEEKRRYLFDSLRQPESLQGHLRGQLGTSGLDKDDREIAGLLIGDIDPNGYYRGSFPDLIMISGRTEAQLLRLLRVIQGFDPPGIGARDLSECLTIQLRQMKQTPEVKAALKLAGKHLEELAAGDFPALRRLLDVDEDMLKQAVALVKSLNPRPGAGYASADAVYVTPEVFAVRGKDGKYHAKVEDRQMPDLHISPRYLRLLADPNVNAETKSFIRERIRAAEALMRNIEQRQDTIRRIAQAIIDEQPGFFERGETMLRPMTMADIAAKVGVHETTVSRTVANKYIETPQGLREMRKFFTHGVKNRDGESVSVDRVFEMIKQYFANEKPGKPLSDQAVSDLLKTEGYDVARRTVAKYRDILGIPSARDRRH